MKISSCLLSGALFFVSPFVFGVGDAAKGKAKAAACVACHGAKGISVNPIWPNLAGQHAKYLAQQLKQFKSGERKGDATMIALIKSFSDEDIENVAAYYNSLKACK